MARPPPLPGHTAGDRSPVLSQHQGASGRMACRRQSRHGTRQAPHVSLWPRRDLNGTAAPPTPTPSPGPGLCAEPFLRPKPERRETAGLRQLTLTTSGDARWPLRRHLPLPLDLASVCWAPVVCQVSCEEGGHEQETPPTADDPRREWQRGRDGHSPPGAPGSRTPGGPWQGGVRRGRGFWFRFGKANECSFARARETRETIQS